MLELVFVIVVIGILAVLSLSRMDRDMTQEAADNILSDIRFTQHLALTDNKHQFDNRLWERGYWRMIFSTCSGGGKYYMIGSDQDLSGANNAFFEQDEAAIDPANGKRMFWKNNWNCDNGDPANTFSDRIFLTEEYGITGVSGSDGCAGRTHIAFDHWGRPYHGTGFSNTGRPYHTGYMRRDCTFTFTWDDGRSFAIQINEETGYAWIVGQPHS